VITPGYLETLRVPLTRGRFFDSRDSENAPLVAIVNQKAARDFWPNQDPIGKRIKLGRIDRNGPWMQVVGVTGDVKHVGLNEPSRQEVYVPYLQAKASLQWQRFLAVRTRGEPLRILTQLRQIATSVDPEEPLNHVMTMMEIVERETAQGKMQTALLGGLAALALIMASVGIYGVMAYLVTQRTQEMGIRMALGAQRKDVLALVLRRGMALTMVGVGTGLGTALLLTRLMGSLLFGVSPTDPLVMATVSILLAAVAFLACFIPASRAASIDPMHALRVE
jgi:predicted permease